MLKWIKNQRGFTLVEIIISIAILGIIITPLSSLFVSSVNYNSKAKYKEIANHLAQKYMEKTMMMDKSEYITFGTQNATETVDGKSFNIQIDLSETVDTYILSKKNDSAVVPSYDATIDSSSGDIADGDTLDIEVVKTATNIQMDIKNHPITIASLILADAPINIKVYCKDDKDFTLNIKNNSGNRLNIYKNYSATATNQVDINTLIGSVYVYENIYDDSVEDPNRNRVYKIKITVKNANNGEVLAQLVNFKTLE